METQTTQSRALQLVLMDMDVKKPTDTEIAVQWGLSDARDVRKIRNTDSYVAILEEFQTQLYSYVGEHIGQLSTVALRRLEELLPTLADSAASLLARPDDAPPSWHPSAQNVRAANDVVKTLYEFVSKLANIKPEDKETRPLLLMPDLVIAESHTKTIKQYHSAAKEEDVVEGIYSSS